MRALCYSSDLQAIGLPVSGTDNQARIDRAIAGASDWVERYCQQAFLPTVRTLFRPVVGRWIELDSHVVQVSLGDAGFSPTLQLRQQPDSELTDYSGSAIWYPAGQPLRRRVYLDSGYSGQAATLKAVFGNWEAAEAVDILDAAALEVAQRFDLEVDQTVALWESSPTEVGDLEIATITEIAHLPSTSSSSGQDATALTLVRAQYGSSQASTPAKLAPILPPPAVRQGTAMLANRLLAREHVPLGTDAEQGGAMSSDINRTIRGLLRPLSARRLRFA